MAVPLGFKAVVVDFINSEQRKRRAHGMQRTGLNDLQHGLRRLRFQFRNEPGFRFSERLHSLSIANGTSSVRGATDKEDANFLSGRNEEE